MNKEAEKPSIWLKGKDNRARLLFLVIISTAVSGMMLYFTGLVPKVGQWYSFDQSFRLQTDAFLRGELPLNPVPYGHRPDWVWGNGIHQVWGLGVPIIRLPFEILARSFGSFGFPDRIVFIIFYFLVTAIFWKALDSAISPDMTVRDLLIIRARNIPLLFFGLLNPALITLVRAKFEPYDEVVAYSYLWALMLFALTLLFLNNRKRYLFFLISLLAGFSPNIRPTAIFYGTVTFLMAIYFAKKYKTKFLWLGPLLFSAGIIFLLATNYMRFNSPLEFGHKLLLSGLPVQDYFMKFENPASQMPFSKASGELFSDIFFTDLNTPSGYDQNPVNGAFIRLREFHFRPYDSLTPFLLLFSWVIVVANRNNRNRHHPGFNDKFIQVAGIWSFCSFIMLFYLYLRFPVLTSRYFVDFGASIVIGITALYLYISAWFQDSNKVTLNLILGASFLGWSLFSLNHAKINYRSWHRSEIRKMTSLTPESAKEVLLKMRHTEGNPLPSEYKCKDQETNYGIPFNNYGWDISGNCTVSIVTTHFLDASECLALHIEPLGGVPEWVIRAYSDEEIEVKAGLKKMQRNAYVKSGPGKMITFCNERKNTIDNNKGPQIELISIKWSDLKKHPNFAIPPLRLMSLGKGW